MINAQRFEASILALVGVLLFALMNATAKYLGLWEAGDGVLDATLGGDISVIQMTFARYAIAAMLVLPFALFRRDVSFPNQPRRYLIRTVAGLGGITLMFAAIQVIPLASATAIGFTNPVFAVLFAALFLSEKVGLRRWLAIALGLSGALIIASPSSGLNLFGASLALVAAACMGAEIVAIRWLAQTSDSRTKILLFSNLFGTVISGGILLFSGYATPSPYQMTFLILIGVLAILGQVCVISAARITNASFIAPFFYVSLFYASLIGYFGFGEHITVPVILGCAAILSSAAIMVHANGRENAHGPEEAMPKSSVT